MEIDIATKVIDPDQHIWSVFPGAWKRFLPIFVERKAIFLDLPGVNLKQATLEDDDLLRQHVAMSRAIGDWYDADQNNKFPSRRASSYPVKRDPSFNAVVGNARNLFARMKVGDLVLVGGYTAYDPILIGEIVGPFDPDFTVEFKDYGAEKLPARRVRWIRTNQERRFLSHGLSKILSNRRAVVTVDKERYGDEVYKIAYGDYVFGTEARYVFEGPTYDNIATKTVPGIRLISYFAAAFHAIEDDELDQFSALSIDEAIQQYFEGDILYSFEINFASPGGFVLHAKRAALPLLAAALVFATSGNISSIDKARAAEIVNSAEPVVPGADSATDNCAVEIKEKYKAIMESINAARFNELCTLNKDAQDGVGLKVRVKAKPNKVGTK